MAYDYRTHKGDDEDLNLPADILGIRTIYWVNGWPTIWQLLSITFKVNTEASRREIGQPLTILLSNVGEKFSVVAFDLIDIAVGQNQERR